MAKTLSRNILEAAAKRNVFASNGFRLFEDFQGDYTLDKIETRTVGGAKSANAFSLHLTHKDSKKKLVLPDWVVGRAFISDSDDQLDIKVKVGSKTYKGVGYIQDHEDKIAGAARFGEVFLEKDEDGNYVDEVQLPDEFKIVGAVTTKVTDDPEREDETSHPAIPLRYYKGYAAVLRHHRKMEKEAGNEDADNAFLTRAQFEEYLEQNANAKVAADRIDGLDQSITKLELVNPDIVKTMGMWNVILVLADTKKSA